MTHLIVGGLMAQTTPATTTAQTAFTASGQVEIKKIVVCNVSGAPADYSIYHDDDGTTYNTTTALWYTKTLAAKSTDVINAPRPEAGIIVAPGGSLGVQASVANALTFTCYGVPGMSR